MNIAISIPENDNHQAAIPYLVKLAEYLVNHHPQLNLLLLTEKENQHVAHFKSNQQVVIWPKLPDAKNSIAGIWFRLFQLKRLLKRQRINVLISHDLHIKSDKGIHQILLVEHQSRLNQQAKWLHQVQQIVATDEWLAECIREKTNTKVETIPPGIDATTPTDTHDFKNTHTEDKDYFCCHALDLKHEQLITILKGFSAFKKMQRSGMKLLLLLNAEQQQTIGPALSNYKYKDDVVCFSEASPMLSHTMMASAYANIFLQQNIRMNQCMLTSIGAGVPFIIDDDPALHSTLDNIAAFSEKTEKDIARNLMDLYKDEAWRQSLLTQAGVMIQERNWNQLMSQFVALIMSANS